MRSDAVVRNPGAQSSPISRRCRFTRDSRKGARYWRASTRCSQFAMSLTSSAHTE